MYLRSTVCDALGIAAPSRACLQSGVQRALSGAQSVNAADFARVMELNVFTNISKVLLDAESHVAEVVSALESFSAAASKGGSYSNVTANGRTTFPTSTSVSGYEGVATGAGVYGYHIPEAVSLDQAGVDGSLQLLASAADAATKLVQAGKMRMVRIGTLSGAVAQVPAQLPHVEAWSFEWFRYAMFPPKDIVFIVDLTFSSVGAGREVMIATTLELMKSVMSPFDRFAILSVGGAAGACVLKLCRSRRASPRRTAPCWT